MKKIIFLSLFLFLFHLTVMAQNMSKQAMQEDLAFLVRTIKEVNPHIAIRETVTGSRLYHEMDSLQKMINDDTSFEAFYYLAQRILLTCQDQHNNFRHYSRDMEEKNQYITDEATRISDQYRATYDYYDGSYSLAGISYIDGRYYFVNTIFDEEKNILLPAGAELIGINNIAIDEYIANYNRHFDNSVRWDFIHNKYYTYRIYHPFLIGVSDEMFTDITYRFNDSSQTLRYMGNGSIAGNVFIDNNEHKVLYFEEENILYIRIPAMTMEYNDFFLENILNYKNSPVSKIVIDIRSNGGGNDELWMNILSTLIDDPFKTITEKCYLRNTPTIRDYAAIRGIQLNEQDSKTIGQDTFVAMLEAEPEQQPRPSLNYTGKIYVMVNEHCFSSALAFSSTCNRLENVITVGQPSGYIGGRGVTPFYFSLPNSQLIFSLSPVLDATGITDIEDYYDKSVKIPVQPSVEDILFEQAYKDERYGQTYLFNYDPVFKKVLEQ